MKPRIGWHAIARYLAGESSADEAATVRAWAEEDRRHAEILESSRRAWDAADPHSLNWNVDRAWHDVAQRMQPDDTVISIARPPRRRARVWLLPAAAAAVLLLIAVPLLRRYAMSGAAETVFATGAGEQRTVQLADGSVARLAENTRLRVTRTSDREVWLEGTAFFGVAEQNVPFVVHTSAGEARVLGTRFELRAERTSMRLAVLEGRVALSGAGQQQVVEAGQVSLAESGDAPSTPRPADVQKLVRWMGKVLIFQDTPLQQAAQEIERLYGFDVRIDDVLLRDRTVTAMFENENPSTVVTTLCRVVDARCDLQDKVVRISH